MFRCTICKKEFETKPDFCDCGNDEFECLEIQNEKEVVDKKEKYIEKEDGVFETFQDEKDVKDIGELVSIAIFLVCIVLSAFFIFFFNGNDKNIKPKAQPSVQKNETLPSIPDIDEIWIQTKINTKKEAVILNSPTVAPKEEKREEVKIVVSQKPIIKPQKIVSKSSLNVIKKTKKPKQIAKVELKQQITKQPKQQINQQINQQGQQPNQQTKQASLVELKNYKIALRNLIASKINFAAIAGDGKCSVTFQISNTGKLINRSFVALSSNDTLNDNVYSALLKTPSFSPPPSSYNNEKFKLNVSIYNGDFEVTLF